MYGVKEVLSESWVTPGSGWILLLLGSITVGCLAIARLFWAISEEDGLKSVFAIGCIALCCLGAYTSVKKDKEYGYTEYKVLFEEDANFLEISELYEIKDQEGKIYTIIVKKEGQ